MSTTRLLVALMFIAAAGGSCGESARPGRGPVEVPPLPASVVAAAFGRAIVQHRHGTAKGFCQQNPQCFTRDELPIRHC